MIAHLALAGCNGTPVPGCSDDETRQGVNAIFKDNLRATDQVRAVFDADKSSVELDSITTTSRSDRLIECQAIAHVKAAYTPAAEQSAAFAEVSERVARQRSIDYSVRMTDDGRLLFQSKMDTADLQ